jgi:hypothetical protein
MLPAARPRPVHEQRDRDARPSLGIWLLGADTMRAYLKAVAIAASLLVTWLALLPLVA